jgi:uncharacterized protein (TIGR00730 family)
MLLLASLLYIACGLGLGLLISTISVTQQEAFLSSFLVFMPTILLSGFMFPVNSMPAVFQWLTLANPVRHYLEIVRSTIVVFGSARLLPPDVARRRLEEVEARIAAAPPPWPVELSAVHARARKDLEYSRYYDEARRFAQMVSRRFQESHRRDFVVVTGGGPGIMEGANRGAFEVGARSIGLNITLAHEQTPNPYITPELCFRFHYFALRKMHFMMRAKGLVAFPGGFGTFDELFESLTLIQTKTIAPMPVVLVGRDYWAHAVDFDFLVAEGMIAEADKRLFHVVDTAEEIVGAIDEFYGGATPR